jgi:predicted HTH transcriptional regulator
MLADRVAITKTDPHLAADEVVRALHRQPIKSRKTISLNTNTTVEFKFAPNGTSSGLTHAITGSINALVPSVIEFMSDRIKHEFPVKRLSVITRELIVNAIAHRDYTHPNNIFVIVSEDLIKVTSPGMLPTPLKLKDLKYSHVAIARNPKLSYDLYKLGYMELFGMGLQSLDHELQERGWPAPRFAHRKGHFVVEIHLPTDLTKS